MLYISAAINRRPRPRQTTLKEKLLKLFEPPEGREGTQDMAVAWESSKRRDCPRRFSKRSASSPPRAHLPLSQIADDSFDVQLSQADESGKGQIMVGNFIC